MQSSREILEHLWTLAGGESSALDAVTLTGEEPQLPSSFRVGAAAQTRSPRRDWPQHRSGNCAAGKTQDVTVDMRHAVVECRSERYLRVDGKPPRTGLGRHRRGLQNPRPALRAAAHQFPASPRCRLQGAELPAGARRRSGRPDAMGCRAVRDRGLCRRRRGRDDALAARNGRRRRRPRRWPHCRRSRSRKSARPRPSRGPREIVRSQESACWICRG